MAIVLRIQFVSRHMCFLEKLLIFFRHFILPLMYLPSEKKRTVVLPQNDIDIKAWICRLKSFWNVQYQ